MPHARTVSVNLPLFYVGFNRWSVFLPLAVDSLWYRPSEWSGSFAFRGHKYLWPVESIFGIKDPQTC